MVIGVTLSMIPGEQDRFLYLGRHHMGSAMPSPPIKLAGKARCQLAWPSIQCRIYVHLPCHVGLSRLAQTCKAHLSDVDKSVKIVNTADLAGNQWLLPTSSLNKVLNNNSNNNTLFCKREMVMTTSCFVMFELQERDLFHRKV
jgi:hypothetical protein